MNKKLMQFKDPDIAGIDAALRRAAQRALQIGLETGTPVYVLEHGKIVDLTKRHRCKRRSGRRVRRAERLASD
jgi:hypothetical protein